MRLFGSQTPSKGGRIRITIVTAAAVAIVFLFYYLHFRNALDRIHVRNLRLLANMSTQIEDAIGGYVSVAKSLYENPCSQFTKVGRFLNDQTSLYTLPPHPPEECKSKTGRCFFIEHDLEGVSWLHLHMRQPTTSDGAASGAWKPACAVANRKLEPVNAGVNLNSEFEYFMPTDEFGGTFDLVLIANMAGEIVYQTPHTQLHVANLQSLVHGETAAVSQAATGEAKPSKTANPFEDIRQTSSLTEVKLAGSTYDLYTQPIRLASIQPEELANAKWVLCAFARPINTYKQALRIPFPVMLVLIDILALMFFVLPWIRIRFLARHERIRRRDVVFGAASACFGLVLMLALPVYGQCVSQFKQQTNEQLKTIADKLQTQMTEEVKEIVAYAQAADKQFQDMTQPNPVETNVLKTGNGYLSGAYPFADLVFWIDGDGRQAYKWSAFEDVSPFIDVSTNQFYIRFRDEMPYRLGNRPDDPQFYLDGLLAPTTGTYKAIVGVKTGGSGAKSSGLSGLFVVAQPRSLFRTVLPPGFAFCVAEAGSGEVLFHSDTRRNRNENLFRETEDNEALKGVVAARAGMVETEYQGRRDLVYVEPLRGIGASSLVLVVFADRLYHETAAAEIATVGISLYAVYFLILSAILGLTCLFIRPVPMIELIWPQAGSVWRYLSTSAIMAVYATMLLAWSIHADPAELAYGTLFTGTLAASIVFSILSPKLEPATVCRRIASASIAFVLVGAWAFGLQHRWSIPALTAALGLVSCAAVWMAAYRIPPRVPRIQVLDLYTLTVLLVIVGISAAPAVAFYRVAFRHETRLLLDYGQRHIGHAIRQRENEMYWLLKSDRLTDEIKNKWKDLDRGLYHSAFYDTSVEILKQADQPPASPDLMTSTLAEHLSYLHASLNTIAVRMWAYGNANSGVSPASGGAYWLTENANREIRLVHILETLDGRKIRIASLVPGTGMAASPVLGISALLICGLCFMGLRSGARRVFAMDWRILEPLEPHTVPTDIDRNYVVLVAPSSSQNVLTDREDLFWIDFAKTCASDSRQQKLASLDSIRGWTIAIRNFDYNLQDVELNQWKLQFLERAVLGCGHKVILITAADPSYHFETQEELPVSVRHRWRLVLQSFTRLRLPAEATPDALTLTKDAYTRLDPSLPQQTRLGLARYLASECAVDVQLCRIAANLPVETFHSKLDILAELERYAGDYYGYLWETCSREEQILLYQIAKYRFANPLASEAAYQLRRKGLITSDPTQWMMNRSFRRFVRSRTEPEPLAARTDETQRSEIEQSAIVVLVAAALPLVVGLVILLPETPQGGIGVITAALGTLGTLAKLLGGRKASPSS